MTLHDLLQPTMLNTLAIICIALALLLHNEDRRRHFDD